MPFGLTDEFLKGYDLMTNPDAQQEQTEQTEETESQAATTTEESVAETTETTESVAAETAEETVEQRSEEVEQKQITEDDISEELFLKYAEKHGRKAATINELFKAPKSDFDGIELSEWDKKYLQFKKDTNNRPVEDFIAAQKDWSKVSDLELARERVKFETGKDLTREQIDSYLERKLGISDINELDENDELDLAAYTRELRDKRVEEQKKYAVPLETKAAPAAVEEPNMVTLEDGTKMPKEQYDRELALRNDYLKNLKGAVDSVAVSKFKVEFDNNGTKIPFEFEYEFGKQDKHGMLSLAEDVNQTIGKLFRTEKGFDFEGFAKAVWRVNPENWEKEMSAFGNAVRAATIEEMLKEENNVNFNRSGLAKPVTKTEQVDIFGGASGGFGIKYNF